MNCEQARNLFDAFLDQSLSGSLATEFGAHRLACNQCRRELALLEVAGHVIAADSEAPLIGDEFTDRPRSALHEVDVLGVATGGNEVELVQSGASPEHGPFGNPRVLVQGDQCAADDEILLDL